MPRARGVRHGRARPLRHVPSPDLRARRLRHEDQRLRRASRLRRVHERCGLRGDRAESLWYVRSARVRALAVWCATGRVWPDEGLWSLSRWRALRRGAGQPLLQAANQLRAQRLWSQAGRLRWHARLRHVPARRVRRRNAQPVLRAAKRVRSGRMRDDARWLRRDDHVRGLRRARSLQRWSLLHTRVLRVARRRLRQHRGWLRWDARLRRVRSGRVCARRMLRAQVV